MTSYTDGQVLELIHWCKRESEQTQASVLRSLLADRTRLQAKLEAATNTLEEIHCVAYDEIEVKRLADQAIDAARAAIGDSHEA